MRERIFSRVLLPAPLRPTMPRTSPCLTPNETSRSAQMVSADPRPLASRRIARTAPESASLAASRRLREAPRCRAPMAYCLLKRWTRTATSLIGSHDVGKRPLGLAEEDHAAQQ